MATAGLIGDDRTEHLITRLADAEFVSLFYRPDGDALAATGILAGALAAIDTPFQATVSRPGSDRETATDADLVVRIGLADPADGTDDTAAAPEGSDGEILALPGEPPPASLAAVDVVRELDYDPDPVLALAGSVAAAVRDARDPWAGPFAEANEALLERGRERDRVGDRRPGVAVPTAEVTDGLAHSTLVHAPFSGDLERTRERCGPLVDGGDSTEIASLLALATVGAERTPPRGAIAIERALRPIALQDSTPVVTLEGYADVLSCVAAERPGVGLALLLGYDVREAALAAWRTHAQRAHAALQAATIARYDGLSVARLGAIAGAEGTNGGGEKDGGEETGDGDGRTAPVTTVARLLRDYRSPEPIALVVGDGLGALSATEDRTLGSVLAEATRDLDGMGGGTERAGAAPFDADPEAFITAVREALADVNRADGDDRTGTAADATVGDRS
jgi:hypothetical protein